MADLQPPNPNLPSPMNLRKLLALAGAFLAVVVILAIIGRITTTPKVATTPANFAKVTITPTGFVPATLSVSKNTKITFVNTDTAPHQIQANPHPTGDSLKGLKSAILSNAQTYSYTFTKRGVYHYHDYLSPRTNGTIDVK